MLCKFISKIVVELWVVCYFDSFYFDSFYGPEKVAQISETQAQHWAEKSPDTCIPMPWEHLEPARHMFVHIKGASRGSMV